MDIATAYRILQLPHTLDKTVVKKRYLELAKQVHPDKNDQADSSLFQRLHEAFTTVQQYISGDQTTPRINSSINTLSNGTVLVQGNMRPGELLAHLFQNNSSRRYTR